MFSIALVVVFGVALLLATLAVGGMLLVAYMEKRRGAPEVPAPKRSASSSSDVMLFFRVRGDVGALFGAHELGVRQGLLDPSALHTVTESLASKLVEVDEATAVYAAPGQLVPYDDRKEGTCVRLRVRSRTPVRTLPLPLEREDLRRSLHEIGALGEEGLIAAHLELVSPRRDRALPKLEALV